ncbi:MAG: hypothetical protein K9L82_17740 [Chromatiaceae bacterium]|nr:hypothetical protein [Chromatiaceae bacterium]MCF8016613.1 hypothetical protein [Chromatiaceae bacterium]
MSDLVVVSFPDQELAFELRAELAKMKKAYLIDIEDIVVATRDEKGKVKLHQEVNLTSAGAVGGAFIIVPLVSAFFIDLTNALIIPFFLKTFA